VPQLDEPVHANKPIFRGEVFRPLSSLLMGMFVTILSGTVISTSLPVIVSELGGGQDAFNWIVISALLATTVSMPVWGKLADLLDRKMLNQLCLLLFVVGSVIGGLAQDTATLIAARFIQGIGAGGHVGLSQVIIADLLSPRERGRYMGIFAAVMALGTIGGPLLGGVITDTVGWRWNFLVTIPIALATIAMLQFTLRLPERPHRRMRIDYFGIVFLTSGVSLLLVWVSLAGSQFAFYSLTSAWMLGGSLVLLTLTVLTELRVSEPIIPLSLFKDRTFVLSVLASIPTGMTMFGTAIFLSQYMQLARGASPTQSGIMTLPMVAGMLLSTTIIGSLISRTGRWKRYVVGGAIAQTVGLVLIGNIRFDTNFVLVSVCMFVLGAGVGALMQNLVLIVQNTVKAVNLGVASAGIAFFRSLGGTLGVSAMGALLGARAGALIEASASRLQEAFAGLGAEGASAAEALLAGTLPQLAQLPQSVRAVIESVYGRAVADTFLAAAPLALIAVVAVVLLPNAGLSQDTGVERSVAEAAAQD